MLEPSPLEQASMLANKWSDYSENFLSKVDSLKALQARPRTRAVGLLDSPISEQGIDIDEAIALIRRECRQRPGLNPASGGHLAYIPGGGIYYSRSATIWRHVSNRYAGVFYACARSRADGEHAHPLDVRSCRYPADSHGNLTTSGTLANMIAVVVARDAKNIKSADIPRSVIYLSKQTHHSIDKAIRVAGLGESILRFVEIDEKFKIVRDGARTTDRGR